MTQPVPNTDTFTFGGTEVVWLDRSHAYEPAEVDRWLVDAERVKAADIKAPMRRAEFERSRMLLRRLTGWQQPFLPDAQNRPSWPAGFRGSLTHKNGHVAVALAPDSRCLAVGFDCEHAGKDISHLRDKICTAHDLAVLSGVTATNPQVPLSGLIPLVFAAKEALFKCHYPLGIRMFWFHDAELTMLDIPAGRFALRVLTDTSGQTPAGFVTEGHFIRKSASDADYWLALCSLSASTASATT
jgi:4'-phosphopantetheinyl transferase EntD